MHNKPPPEDAGEWPFWMLLRFAMDLGLGLPDDGASNRWTASLLLDRISDKLPVNETLNNSSIENWRSGRNVPDERRPALLDVLCAGEAPAWRSKLIEAADRDATKQPSERHRAYRAWKLAGGLYPEPVATPGAATAPRDFRGFVAQLADQQENVRKANEADQAARIERLQRQINQMRQTVDVIRDANARRKAKDFDGAEKRLAAHQADLDEPSELARQTLTARAEALIERANNALDRGLDLAARDEGGLDRFKDAIGFFREAFNDILPGQDDLSKSYRRGLRQALLAAVKEAEFDEGRALLNEAAAWGLTGTGPSWTALMAKVPQFRIGLEVLDDLRKAGVPPHPYIYNMLCRAAEDVAEAEQVVELMRNLDPPMPPGVSIFSMIMHRTAGFAAALRVLQRMPARPDPATPNEVTFGTLMAKAESFRDVLAVIARMEAAGIPPTDQTATAAAQCLHTASEADQLDEWLRSHHRAGPGFMSSAVAALARHLKAEELLGWVFGRADKFDFGPPSEVMATAINAFAAQGKTRDALRVAVAYAFLDAAKRLMSHHASAAQAFFREHYNEEARHASYALAVLHQVKRRDDLACEWARHALGFDDQPEPRIAHLNQIIQSCCPRRRPRRGLAGSAP